MTWMQPAGWVFSLKWQRLEYYEQKFYKSQSEMLSDLARKPIITIPRDAFHDLQDWWDSEGKRRVGSRRKEDLKIINRLIDVIEKAVHSEEEK